MGEDNGANTSPDALRETIARKVADVLRLMTAVVAEPGGTDEAASVEDLNRFRLAQRELKNLKALAAEADMPFTELPSINRKVNAYLRCPTLGGRAVTRFSVPLGMIDELKGHENPKLQCDRCGDAHPISGDLLEIAPYTMEQIAADQALRTEADSTTHAAFEKAASAPVQTPAVHPNLRPDPERVQRWRDDMEHVKNKIMELVMFRDDFAKFEKIVRENPRIMNASSPFPARVKQWYCDSQVMRIRRILEGKSERGDVRSLRLILEDMRRACAAFTRDNIKELFDADGAPDYDDESRGFLVESMWMNVGDVANDEDRLCSKHIKGHLAELEAASRRIINYADKLIAHDTIEGVPEPDLPKFSELAHCIDVIEEVAKRYIAALSGAGYSSLSPVAQYDEFDVFRFSWLPPARDPLEDPQ